MRFFRWIKIWNSKMGFLSDNKNLTDRSFRLEKNLRPQVWDFVLRLKRWDYVSQKDLQIFPKRKIHGPKGWNFLDRQINKNPGISTGFSTGKSQNPEIGFFQQKKIRDLRVGIFTDKKFLRPQGQDFVPYIKILRQLFRKKSRIQNRDFSQKNKILQNPGMGFFPIEENSLNPRKQFFRQKKLSDPRDEILFHRKKSQIQGCIFR